MIPQETYEQAIRYYEGKEGIEQCYTKAYALFLEAAKAGHVKALSYTGRMLWKGEGIDKNYEEAIAKVTALDKGWYDDHAVFYKDGRKKNWLVKCEWHC